MSNPRIAIVAPFAPAPSTTGTDLIRKGGVERYVTALSRELARLGLDVTIIAPAEEPGEYEVDGFKLIHFKRWAIWGGAPLFNPLELRKVVKGFDLIHSQATYPLLSDMCPLVAWLEDIPSVVTFHFEPTPTNPKEAVAAAAYRLTLQRLVGLNDRIIFSTQSYRERTRLLRAPRFESRIRYIPMGVDTDFFFPDSGEKKEKRFLFVGRLVPYKDIPLLLRAFSIVRRSELDAELFIVGEGPLESELKGQASKIGGVKFLGKISDEELRSLYRTSIATVLSSHDKQEAFGMTLIESMACGTPAIAAGIPGVREVAAVGGMVAEPGSEQSLADAMIKIARSGGKETIDPIQLHARIEELYSWRAVARKTRDVYSELLGPTDAALTQKRSAMASGP